MRRILRVAVTTTADTAHRVAYLLRSDRLEPVMLPCIRIVVAPPEVLQRVRSATPNADWIVVTSPRAVHVTWPDGGMPEVPVAAVGPATGSAARRAGGRVEVTGNAGAASLLEALRPLVAGKRVAFPHARIADPATVAGLRAAGAEVMAESVYETVPIAPAEGPVDVVIFGSPSAVEGWCRSRQLDGLVVAATGETTTSALIDRGRYPDVVPDRPGFKHLVTALTHHLGERTLT